MHATEPAKQIKPAVFGFTHGQQALVNVTAFVRTERGQYRHNLPAAATV